MGNINKSLHLARKYARMFVRRHYLFREATVFQEGSSRKSVSYDKKIISKDKYPNIFSPQMEAIVFYLSIIHQIFFRNARSFENWGIFNNYSMKLFHQIFSLVRDLSKHVTWPNMDIRDY